MPKVAVVYGTLLVALGLGGYLGFGRTSWTALIPAAIGLPVLLCGLLAHREAYLKHAMHAAAALGLLGFLGSLPGLLRLPRLLAGGEVARPNAVAIQSAMAVLSFLFVLLCVRSFLDARRARKPVA